MMDEGAAAPILEYGVAGDPFEGNESGDLHLVVEANGTALVAVIDGLGHGAEAAIAAREAAAILQENVQEDVEALIHRCHAGLRKTRGVVMTLVAFDARASSMTWIGVGNVDAVLLRARPEPGRSQEALVVRGGVVGFRLPPLRAAMLPVSPGDTLIAATDGLRSGFSDGAVIEREPNVLAQGILARSKKHSDDALVLVARFLGAVR
jgi:negative regulator of sigma-B (phosphoserine phosphatase)